MLICQARVQDLLSAGGGGGGGGPKYLNHKWTLCRQHSDTARTLLGGYGGMLPRENFENRVVFLYSGVNKGAISY